MSRLSHTYKTMCSFKLEHDSELLTQEYVTFFPDESTFKMISKHKLQVKNTPEGLLVLYKINEEFDPVTVDETIIIEGVPVINKKVVGYVKSGQSTNWLPNTATITLTFYGVTNNIYKKDTIWQDLNLNKYIKYSSAMLNGVETVDNNITSFRKPDAVFELLITDANIIAGNETKFEFKTEI